MTSSKIPHHTTASAIVLPCVTIVERIQTAPEKIYQLLDHPELQEEIVRRGREKVLRDYTTKRNAERILEYLQSTYGL